MVRRSRIAYATTLAALACHLCGEPPLSGASEGDSAKETSPEICLLLLAHELNVDPAHVTMVATPLSDEPGVFVAVYEWVPGWDGGFAVFGCEGETAVWTARVNEPPAEQSILEARVVSPVGHGDKLLEVVGITHAGNGSVYVYRLEERALELLFSVKVVDQHDDGELFGAPHHVMSYEDKDGDGLGDITVSGTINSTVSDANSRTVLERFYWSKEAQRFVSKL